MGPKQLRYIGVDPSLRSTGLALVGEGYLECVEITVEELGDRSTLLAYYSDKIARYLDMARRQGADVALIEGYSFASKGNAALLQAEVGGVCRSLLAKQWPVIEVPVGTWRSLTINRFGVVPGKGTKAERELYLSEVEQWFGFRAPTHNCAEAALICRAADIALNEGVRLGEGGMKLRDALVDIWRAVYHGR